ncbi:hypothetical protein GNI_077640 [Gregarina niphandrodes]|uniref:Uncharacterized protein n=1 Tax=Gregarina niphandrodes TaxID=110365 RepID=A0A023B6P7_GRENI|nr:hypothetical protein GNI_077640 [Gregarina niphandrodes]EZG66675.1 hypothetical protein GNI_077640 [Gregarina niphandrodes]|eukprot:XP_011130526.1 hypothetical protein GNI_077640 [Gregarina niphandrodes]
MDFPGGPTSAPVIIFDWDDTFLPTAILRALAFVPDSSLLELEFDHQK